MKTTFSVLLLLISYIGNAQIRNSYNDTDILHTALNLTVDWHKRQIKGTATIRLVATQQIDTLRLDAGFLSIHSISLNEGIPLPFSYDGGDKPKGLIVYLNKTFPKNTELTLTIAYHTQYVNESDPNNLGGSYGKGVRFFQPTQSTPIKRKQLWSNGEPEGNKYWYPCIESLSDLRTTELIATVDAHLTVISNGTLIAEKQHLDGTKTFHFQSNIAYPNYLTNMIVGEYTNVKQYCNQIPFNTFCYPDEKEAATASANRLTDMATYFSNYIGVSYPYPSYSQVMVQDYPFPSLSGQHGVSTISDNFVDDERTHKDFLYLWDGVEAEALATQWFGNWIVAKNWNHIWITKALAHFLEGKYAAQKNGRDEYHLWYQRFDMGATLGDWNAGIHRPLVVENIPDLNRFLTGDNYLRSRGALVLRMLEMEVGEENFQKSIQYFVQHHANKPITTQAFQNAVEYVAQRKMDWFFDQWVYKMGHPQFEVMQSYDPSQKLLQLKILQTQTQDSGAEYPQVMFFQGKMQIEIEGNLHTIHLQPQKENVFEFSLSKEPKWVNINHESTWIAEIKMQKSLQAYAYQLEKSKDVLAKIHAMEEMVSIYKDTTTSVSNKNKIYHTLLTAVDSKLYWRFRINVLTVLNSILPKPFDTDMKRVLQKIILNEKALLKASAISVLGAENNTDNAHLFIKQFNDNSDRVIFNAAIALGKTQHPKAFDALAALIKKPSWKGQSKMAALAGMQLLGDERAVPIALDILKDNQSPRWFLGASGWDYPVYAATTLATFNKGHLGYECILARFDKAMLDNDIQDIFNNVLLISILADPRATEVFEKLKIKYKEDANAMAAINAYEMQFNDAIKH